MKQLEQEVKTLPPGQQQSVAMRVRNYRSIVSGFRREFASIDTDTQRDVLVARQQGRLSAAEEGRIQQARLQGTTGKIEEGNAILKNTNRMAQETEATGVAIMGDLRQQREVILQSRAHIDTIDGNLTQSQRVLTQMSRRILTNKIILAGTALTLSLTLLLLLFIKLRHY